MTQIAKFLDPELIHTAQSKYAEIYTNILYLRAKANNKSIPGIALLINCAKKYKPSPTLPALLSLP